MFVRYIGGFPGSSAGKESACNAGDPGLIPGLGSSLGKGIGYPLQYSWASLVAQLVKNPPVVQGTAEELHTETSSRLVSRSQCSSPGATGISGLHSRRTRGDRHSSRVETTNPALLSSRDGYLLELTGWTKGSQAS